jgi:CRP-like cAMP-binding protein
MADSIRRDFLLRSPLFQKVPDDLLAALVEITYTRQLPDRTRLHAKGDPADGMYAVVKGCIRASSSTADGREALLALFDEGCWFGESSLLDGLPRAFNADAQGDSEVLVIPRDHLNSLLDARPELYRYIIPFLCQRIRLSTLLLEGNALLSLEERLASRLLLLAQNALQGGTDKPRHTLTLSQENLSQMLGTSRQSINKVLKDWETNGWIERHYGSITLCDLEAMKRLSMAS